MEMNAASLKKICRDLQLYSTPELNDKIYLHYKGFKKIENLDAFTGLKVIYLEGNGFRKIEGLDKLKELRCLSGSRHIYTTHGDNHILAPKDWLSECCFLLVFFEYSNSYLQENQIVEMENLSELTDLDSLNLNQNLITAISGLSELKKLNTLLLQGNKLKELENIRGVLECPSLGVLDISKNLIEDEGILDILSQLPKLKVLYLKDNPVVEKIANYRKRVISSIPTLTYLDDRPVFEDERRTCDAWARGGKVAEAAERTRIEVEKSEKEERNYKAFENMMKEARREQGITEEENEEPVDDKQADSDSDAETEAKQKEAAEREAPALEEAESQLDEHIVRPTAKITFTHSNTPSSSTSTSAPILSLNPTKSSSTVATANVQTSKRLIEMVDDEPEEKVNETTENKPDRTLIQQLD